MHFYIHTYIKCLIYFHLHLKLKLYGLKSLCFSLPPYCEHHKQQFNNTNTTLCIVPFPPPFQLSYKNVGHVYEKFVKIVIFSINIEIHIVFCSENRFRKCILTNIYEYLKVK